MKYLIVFYFSVLIISSCSSSREVVLTYKNWDYSGERLFPIQTNSSEFSFRIWMSKSTSIDRVITIYKDPVGEFYAKLIELGQLHKRKKRKNHFKEYDIVPKEGFSIFKSKLDSLNLFELKSKSQIEIIAVHQPISTYVVEIKNKERYNTFHFDMHISKSIEGLDEYSSIVKLITEQFPIHRIHEH